jgi:hypothetical protein
VTWIDRAIRVLKVGGYAAALVSLPLVLTDKVASIGFFSWPFVTGVTASVAQEIRARLRSDVMGERWLRFWKGFTGRGVFKLAGVGLKRVAAAITGAHRPTEVAIGLAADRLFEELPKDVRKELDGLPQTVKTLEDDAQTMRRQLRELEAVLAEIGDDDPARPGARERARVRESVKATRDEAREKLEKAVKALETIRLGLLLMHTGGASAEHLTMDLASARDISDDISNLLDGHREVERMLRERRETGVLMLDAPTDTVDKRPKE